MDDAFKIANSIDANILKVRLTSANVTLSLKTALPTKEILTHTCSMPDSKEHFGCCRICAYSTL